MTKKKTAKKTAKKTKPTGKTATKSVKAARSVTLPGMEQYRSQKLDNACERIADARATMATLRADEAGDERIALDLMRGVNITSYRYAGVELVRVPGEEKLRVRTSKVNATAEGTVQHDDSGDGEDI